MFAIGTQIRRKVRAAYHAQRYRQRAQQTQDLRRDIQEDLLAATPASSHISPSTITFSSRSSTSVSVSKDSTFERLSSSSSSEANSESNIPLLRPESPYADDPFTDEAQIAADDPKKNPPSPSPSSKSSPGQSYTYIIFDGEDEADYTDGPVRLARANDGVGPCAGLLMTLDFSAKIQATIRAQRSFNRVQIEGKGKDAVNFTSENDLQDRILQHEGRLLHLSGLNSFNADDEASRIEIDLASLRVAIENTRVERQRFVAELETQRRRLLDVSTVVISYLDEAFVSANLIEPADSPLTEPKTSSVEGQSICSSDSSSPSDPTPQGIVAAYRLTHQRFLDAREAFEAQDEQRAIEWRANCAAFERGEETGDLTPETFDARWRECALEVHRKLVKAEKAFEAAKATVREAGMRLEGDELRSDIFDDGSQGDGGVPLVVDPEDESKGMGSRITNWLTSVPDAVPTASFP